MFIHANIVKAAFDALNEIFGKGIQSDAAVAEMLTGNPKWGARDRNQATGIVYNIVRYAIQYRFVGNVGSDNSAGAIKWLINIYALQQGFTLPPEYTLPFDGALLQSRWADVARNRALRLSMPEWLDDLGYSQLGENWETEMAALNTEAKFCLRINTIKAAINDVLTRLQNANIEFTRIPGLPEAVVLAKRYNLKNNLLYTEGLIEIQDVSSQMVARKLDVHPNMRVLDACAGAGGKTLHMAALMGNNGQIVATDVSNPKLNILLQRCRKADAHIIATFKINETFIKNNYRAFDRILIDAPCSSLGTLRRKPDLKHSITEERLKEIVKLQQEILLDYFSMLKPGGKMLYSTCSILPLENDMQVKSFVDSHPDFELLSEEYLSPAHTGFDGFYMGLMRRKL